MKTAFIVLAALVVAAPAFAQDAPPADERKIFVMGGRMAESHFHQMLFPFTAVYEDAGVVGGGYQQFFGEPFEGFRMGLEVGGAVRVGEKVTGEMWGGVVGRYDGFVVGDTLRVSPAITFGVSVVDDVMGIEAQRAAGDGLPGDILFYLSPEVSFSSVEAPETEIFWRLHHRSGAWNSFGGGGSANATAVGIRTSF